MPLPCGDMMTQFDNSTRSRPSSRMRSLSFVRFPVDEHGQSILPSMQGDNRTEVVSSRPCSKRQQRHEKQMFIGSSFMCSSEQIFAVLLSVSIQFQPRTMRETQCCCCRRCSCCHVCMYVSIYLSICVFARRCDASHTNRQC